MPQQQRKVALRSNYCLKKYCVLCYKARSSRVRLSMGSLIFFSAPNPSSRIMDQAFIGPVREMITGGFLGSKTRPAFKADNLTAICEPTV
jgi:hypothetical protein